MDKPRLLDQVRDALRVRHYSLRTEESYLQWIKRFILFHGKRHPTEMGEQEITAFLTFLAVDKHVSPSTQNQALSALLFLYKQVLEQELEWMDDIVRAKRSERIPEVLSPDQVRQLINHLAGTHQLMARLLYGTGMRLMEVVRLRVRDVDFHYRQITVRSGKGNKDRVTVLPASLFEAMKAHLTRVKALHVKDLAEGGGSVYLPYALAQKYPSADREWGWQYVFPAPRAPVIRAAARSAGTMCMSKICSGPSSRPWCVSDFPARYRLTPCGIPSRPTSWKADRIFALSRNFWATRM